MNEVKSTLRPCAQHQDNSHTKTTAMPLCFGATGKKGTLKWTIFNLRIFRLCFGYGLIFKQKVNARLNSKGLWLRVYTHFLNIYGNISDIK